MVSDRDMHQAWACYKRAELFLLRAKNALDPATKRAHLATAEGWTKKCDAFLMRARGGPHLHPIERFLKEILLIPARVIDESCRR